MQLSIAKKSVLLIFLVLLIDQITKVYIKLHLPLGSQVNVLSWFKLVFVENNGMAFGIELFSKVFLTSFRILAVVALAFYIRTLIRKGVRQGYILVVSLVLAGAAGNIIDCLFYGILFSDSYGHIATFLPDTASSPFFMGKVVDMLHFPLIKDANGEAVFFRPVFNIADSAISVAVVLILLFYRKELNDTLDSKKKEDADEKVVEE